MPREVCKIVREHSGKRLQHCMEEIQVFDLIFGFGCFKDRFWGTFGVMFGICLETC